MLPQGPFDLYNWGSLLLGTLPLPHAPWTLRFSILVGGSKHFFPALCKHQMQCLQYFWLLFLGLGKFPQTWADQYSAEHWRDIFHICPLATSVELTPLWHSLWELPSTRASGIFNSTSSTQEVFWALVWVPRLLFQPGGSQGRKMLNCSAHLIHFLFLEDPCFCCLISNNLKNVVSYNFSYICCFSVLFFLSWDCKSSPCCSISARSQSFCYTLILLKIFVVF